MTRRERFERALRCEEVDRLPFWAKVFGDSYLAFQDEKYRAMGELELADYLDLDHMAGGGVAVACTNPRVERHVEQTNGLRVVRETTPDGTLTTVERSDPATRAWHPVEFPIKTRADLRAARHIFAGNRFEAAPDALARSAERLAAVADRGIVITSMGISPLMNLIQHLIGPDATYFFLSDFPDEMDELIALMHAERLRYLRAMLPACAYDYICSVENTSTTLLSPAVFERYCWPHLADYGRLIREHGKHHVLHMCGHLKALLPRIGALPAIAIEAFTSPPVGNTTLADRARLCPRTSVIGGTSAVLWLQPANVICETIERDLAEAGTMRGVVLTSAGVMPPACPLEKVRQVREFVKGITEAGLSRAAAAGARAPERAVGQSETRGCCAPGRRC